MIGWMVLGSASALLLAYLLGRYHGHDVGYRRGHRHARQGR